MEDGWYWHLMEKAPPEIVQVISDTAYRAGQDVGCTLPGAPQKAMLDRLEGTLMGPVTTPDRTIRLTRDAAEVVLHGLSWANNEGQLDTKMAGYAELMNAIRDQHPDLAEQESYLPWPEPPRRPTPP